jgi:hypothetical protein
VTGLVLFLAAVSLTAWGASRLTRARMRAEVRREFRAAVSECRSADPETGDRITDLALAFHRRMYGCRCACGNFDVLLDEEREAGLVLHSAEVCDTDPYAVGGIEEEEEEDDDEIWG